MTITGTSGNDHLSGTSGNDDFDVSQGGDDVVRGKAGDNSYAFGAAYTLADTVQGGGDFDGILLNGFYGSPIVFGANITSIEQISIVSDLNYTVTMRDAAVAAGRLMNFDGGTLDTGNHFTLDASAESDGQYFVTGSSGADIIKMGAGADEVFGGGGGDTIFGGAGDDFLSAGFVGSDTVYGADGSDVILFEGDGAWDITDRVFGGNDIWSDTLELDGDYSGGLTITKTMVQRVDTIKFDGGNSFLIDANNVAKFAAGGPYIFDSSDLQSGDTLMLDIHAGTSIIFYGGDGTDIVSGGKGYNDYHGGGGADVFTAHGGGPDVFNFHHVSDSTSATYDTVANFDAQDDFFYPVFPADAGFQHVTGVDDRVNHGALSTGSFDSDLGDAIGRRELAADHAVLFAPDSGNQAGQLFLIIDANNRAGYQAGKDVVVHLVDAKHMNAFDIDNFGTAG